MLLANLDEGLRVSHHEAPNIVNVFGKCQQRFHDFLVLGEIFQEIKQLLHRRDRFCTVPQGCSIHTRER